MKIQSSDQFADILTNKSKDEILVTKPKQINSVFQSFYSEFYKSQVVYNKSTCDTFLHKLELSCLSEEEAKKLAEPISLKKLEQSVRNASRKVTWNRRDST